MDDRWRFLSNSRESQHALRVIGRVRALQMVNRARHDAEEVDDVDVDICSLKSFVKLYDKLPDSDRLLLAIFRSGRLHPRREGGQESHASGVVMKRQASDTSSRTARSMRLHGET